MSSQQVQLCASAFVHLKSQPGSSYKGDVLYVHGATFPSDLSIFFRFDGRSWADELNDAGFTAWGFDFVGYGLSSRYEAGGTAPRGRADEALPQLLAVLTAIRSQNNGRKVSLVAHSWGTSVAARAAIACPEWIDKVVLFGAPVQRQESLEMPSLSPVRPVNIWEQYRRFIEDVPRDHPPVLLDRHFEFWSTAYLATDPTSHTRHPPSVITPAGPVADVIAHWQGNALYDPGRITRPLLFIRGEWDSVCNDLDARRFMAQVGSGYKRDVKIPEGTHLMHLEESRLQLHRAVNQFLLEP